MAVGVRPAHDRGEPPEGVEVPDTCAPGTEMARYYGLPAVWSPEIEPRIVEAVHRLRGADESKRREATGR